MQTELDGTGLPELAGPGAEPPARAGAVAAARDFMAQARAPATLRAYAADWRAFAKWCRDADLPALPAHPATVAMFVAVQTKTDLKPTTLGRRVVAIGLHHRQHGLSRPQDHPQAQAIADVLSGVAR